MLLRAAMTRPAAYRHASRVILHSASKGHDGTQNQASETRKVAEIRKSSATFPKPMFDTGRMAFSSPQTAGGKLLPSTSLRSNCENTQIKRNPAPLAPSWTKYSESPLADQPLKVTPLLLEKSFRIFPVSQTTSKSTIITLADV